MACTFQSSVGVVATPINQPKLHIQGEVSSYKENKSFFSFLSLPRPIQRFIRSIKNFSHQFLVKKEKKEAEMEIGYPTDVKHVAHIGLNGSSFSNTKGRENIKAPELISFPSISLKQFELAMAAQLHRPSSP